MSGTATLLQVPCQNCQVREKGICSGLDDNELRELNRIVTLVKMDRGGVVFHEGDDGTYLYNVMTGTVRLLKLLPDGRRQIVGFLFPGDFLGLSIGDTYAYAAEAQSDISLCRFRRTELLKLVESHPKLEHRLLQLASNELLEAQDHLLLLGRKTATERVISILLKLADRIGLKDSDGVLIDLPMTRGDLADYTGLSVETVSRTMSSLRKEGAIDTPEIRSVYIPKAAKLTLRSGAY